MEIDYFIVSEYLNQAKTKSPAKKRQVASVFVDENGKILEHTLAINGMLSNKTKNTLISDCCETSDGITTFDTVFHAEEQSIMLALHAGLDCSKLTLCVTYSPCYKCCRTLILSGCKNLVYFEEHPTDFTSPGVENELSPKEFLLFHHIKVMSVGFMNLDYSKLQKQPKEKLITIVHHDSDIDGLMSAWLLNEYVKVIYDVNPIITGYNYQKDHKWMENVACLLEKYSNEKQIVLYFGDITPPVAWLKKYLVYIKNHSLQINIFDHHDNSLSDIKDFISQYNVDTESIRIYDNAYIMDIYNLENSRNFSATGIIYHYLKFYQTLKDHKELPDYLFNIMMERMMITISAYDTWEFTKFGQDERNEILYFNEAVRKYQEYSQLVDDLNTHIGRITIADFYTDMVSTGENISKIKFNQALKFLDNSLMAKIQIGKTIIPIIVIGNTYPDYFINTLIEDSTTCDYWIGWNYSVKSGIIKFSVRANNKSKNANVLDICEHFGGGGHEKAGGFSMEIEQGQKLIFDLLKSAYK